MKRFKVGVVKDFFKFIDGGDYKNIANKSKKINGLIKNNSSKEYLQIKSDLYKGLNKDSEYYELVAYLIALCEIRAIMSEYGIEKKQFSDISGQVLESLSVDITALLDSGFINKSLFSKKFFSCLAYELKTGDDAQLVKFLSELPMDEKSVSVICTLEQGLGTFSESYFYLNDKSLVSKNDFELSIENYCSFLSEEPVAIFLYGVDSKYFKKYFSNILLSSTWCMKEGANVTISIAVHSTDDLDVIEKELFVLREHLTNVNSSDKGGFEVLFIWAPDYLKRKSFYASLRYLLPFLKENNGNKVSQKSGIPIFFPDAEVLPEKRISDFLNKNKKFDYVVGSNTGLKTLLPWRRWLASEFVVFDTEDFKSYGRQLMNLFCLLSQKDVSWFVDQNLIYHFDKLSSLKNKSVRHTFKSKSDHPLIQRSFIKF